jgi:hypothetical protein
LGADAAAVKYGAMLRGASPGAAALAGAAKNTGTASTPIPSIAILRSVFIVEPLATNEKRIGNWSARDMRSGALRNEPAADQQATFLFRAFSESMQTA